MRYIPGYIQSAKKADAVIKLLTNYANDGMFIVGAAVVASMVTTS